MTEPAKTETTKEETKAETKAPDVVRFRPKARGPGGKFQGKATEETKADATTTKPKGAPWWAWAFLGLSSLSGLGAVAWGLVRWRRKSGAGAGALTLVQGGKQ